MNTFRTSRFVLAFTSILLALSLGCGARFGAGRDKRSIDHLRAKAERRPNDVSLWHTLAIAEHVEDGGEPARARKALAHAKKLGAKSLALTLIEAEEHVLEGRPSAALDSYFALLNQSAHAEGDDAALYAEAALSAIGDMNDAVDDYRERLERGLVALEPKADALGLNAAHQLYMSLYGLAMLRGDLTAAAKYTQKAGCVQKAEVAGPFGPRELLGFDVNYPAEKPGPFQQSYDLGPSRGVQPVRALETRRCVLPIGRGVRKAWPGTSVVRAELDVKKKGDYALRFESPNSSVVWLDGKEILRLDLRDKHPEGVRYIPVRLSAGKHELKVKISSRHPNPALSLALVPATREQVEATHLPATPRGALERFLAAKLALSRGNAVGARELLRKKNQSAPTAHWLVLEAATALADPLRPGELRRDLSRELLRRAGQQNPDAWYPVIGLANLEASEGRLKEAIEALRPAVEKWPEVIAIRTSLIERLRERGHVEEAERVVAELAERMPNTCAVIGIRLNTARARSRVKEIEALTERAMACDASSTARLSLLRMQRKYDKAATEYLRLLSLSDAMEPAQLLESEIEHAKLAGDRAQELRTREKRSALFPDRPDPVLDHADRLLAQGKAKEAAQYLNQAIAAYPDELYELRRSAEAINGEDLFAPFRKNGDEVIAAFEASGRKYDEPQVLVLDYTVVRVFPDGSSIDLTHNITRVQSQEAVDEQGEFAIPEGARLLKLHTIKAQDKKKLEPEAIAGKSTLSLPNLAPGDYVEFEIIRGQNPSTGFPGGYIGDRFYFQSFEVPFDHSELVVVLPKEFEPVIDPRGPAPETIRETHDGLKVLRFKRVESRPLTREPNSVNSREFIPSVLLGMKVTWEAYIESLRDLLIDKDVFDPAALDEVNRLLGDDVHAKPSVRARRLYRWVTEQIEPTDDVFGSASAMLAARTGSRERVLRYMLGLAGIKADLVVARGAEADHSVGKLPDPETFGYLLLRVHTELGAEWVHAGARDAPFGFLPPQLWGERALVVSPEAESVQLPNPPIEHALHSVDVRIKLDEKGGAQVSIRETLRGPNAVSWRNDLDQIPNAELNARFEEGYAVQLVPGAHLTDLSFQGRDDPEAPLVVNYKLEVASLGHQIGKEQRIPGLFTSNLSGRYARTSERQTTQLVAPSQAKDVRITFELPKGAKAVSGPRAVKHAFSGASFASTIDIKGNEVQITRILRLPMLRVAPIDYPKLATFCRAVDVAEASELSIALP